MLTAAHMYITHGGSCVYPSLIEYVYILYYIYIYYYIYYYIYIYDMYIYNIIYT